jgi:quercetin dioxygenase-like cupin family protein
MHLTRTLDAIIIVRGRVRLLLDTDERLLGPGDVVVQRGTNHAWVCDGDEPALLVAVLISRTFDSRTPAPENSGTIS